MADNKPQFDVHLGGNYDLPLQVSIKKFSAARAQEIAALTQAIEDPQRTGLVFQKLPKHMRRRVMSHTPKRLPRRLREAHIHQLKKSGLPPKSKRPSRRYRRHPKNLLLEYSRRQRKFVWLETHIWHAKRFHMIEKWGYKLANFPNDKSFRACYRATANHCLLQDISYYNCIELTGPQNILLDHLQTLTNKDCGLTFGAKAFLKGAREGSVMLFHQNCYPMGAIGKVSFLWKPLLIQQENREEENPERTLWIWVHPAFYQEVLEELIKIFDLIEKDRKSHELLSDIKSEVISECPSSSDKEDSEESKSPIKKKARLYSPKKKKDTEKIKLATKNVPFIRTPKYQTNDGIIEMILLKDTLNRFRLTGPLSQAVLTESLHIASVLRGVPDNSDEKEWWNEYYEASQENKDCWNCQKMLWDRMKGAASPANLPPHIVCALTVSDPRLQMPSKRIKALPDDQAVRTLAATEQITEISQLACVSPIWDPQNRDAATASKLSTDELIKMRSQFLVPELSWEDSDIDSEDGKSIITSDITAKVKSRIPVLLIQKPGSQDPTQTRLGFSSGWDIVIPAGWAQPFWLGFIFRGARAGGLRESSSLEFESSSEHIFPPDTCAGLEEAESQERQLKEHHFRLPPDKRPNYTKLGVTSPFICAWNILINEWSQNSVEKCEMEYSNLSSSQFFVLRDKKKLECLKNAVSNLKTKKVINNRNTEGFLNVFSSLPTCCLVNVAVHMTCKGKPSDQAVICLPSTEDLNIISGNSKASGPKEDLHVDELQEERKNSRIEHKKLLKHLRRNRVREKLKEEDIAAKKLASQEGNNSIIPPRVTIAPKRKATDPAPTKDIVDEQAKKMQSLWLPDTKIVRHSCSREVIGFVKKGDFCFSQSLGVGQGYIILPALLKLLSLCHQKQREGSRSFQPWVLVRNPTSLQYRFGMIQVLS